MYLVHTHNKKPLLLRLLCAPAVTKLPDGYVPEEARIDLESFVMQATAGLHDSEDAAVKPSRHLQAAGKCTSCSDFDYYQLQGESMSVRNFKDIAFMTERRAHSDSDNLA